MTAATNGSRRIQDGFARARADGRVAFVPYVVAGYPDAEASARLGIAAIDAGADLLEIGLPYSDPLADGVTLQHASSAALASGATLDGSFEIVERVCRARPDTPVVVMGYVNQFLGPRGARAIADRLEKAGAAGAIVADLPVDEGAPLEEAFERHGLALVYLVAPTSTDERIALIARRAGGFVYCVSLTGVTGARSSGPHNIDALVARVKERSQLPVAVGFGVSRPEHVRAVANAGADGAIVASALIDALGADGRNEAAFATLCKELAAATAAASPAA
jgi:tryptophan synthase alpha chain